VTAAGPTPAQPVPGNGRSDAASAAAGTANSPVIVLTYAGSGSDTLQSLLSAIPGLACTSGTGVLPLVEQAAAAWRQVEGRASQQLSPLAAASIRAMVSSLTTVVLAREGKRRWCELARAQPSAADTFVRLFPGTRVLCLHRACPDVVYETLHASDWGLAGPAFAPFTSAHPASTVAALAAFWATHTEQLIAFEDSHPAVCRRVRYEDLVAEPDQAADSIQAFLSGGPEPAAPGAPAGRQGSAPAGSPPAAAAPLPADQIPPLLLTWVDKLMADLGYPQLRA
jgi:Sulfotransferase family